VEAYFKEGKKRKEKKRKREKSLPNSLLTFFFCTAGAGGALVTTGAAVAFVAAFVTSFLGFLETATFLVVAPFAEVADSTPSTSRHTMSTLKHFISPSTQAKNKKFTFLIIVRKSA
jgi:hypothetical protein